MAKTLFLIAAAFAVLPPAYAANDANSSILQPPQHVGFVVEGTCTNGAVMVKSASWDAPRNPHIARMTSPGLVSRCVPVADGVAPQIGDLVVLGRNAQGGLIILKATAPKQ
jgi:hypothetical protein